MQTERNRLSLKITLLAGLVAGLFMGLSHFIVTEPVIDRAIALEDQAAVADGQAYEPLVSRGIQKAMLVLGSSLYGVVVGLVFGIAFAALGRFLPGRPVVKVLVLAGLLWWSVGLLTFLKYPANPPGVGNPETIFFRQNIQIAFMALSALTVVVAWAGYLLSGRWWSSVKQHDRRLVLAIGLYAVLATVAFVAMPPNPDPVTAPADLVWDFRIMSLSIQAFFWAILGGVTALLVRRSLQYNSAQHNKSLTRR